MNSSGVLAKLNALDIPVQEVKLFRLDAAPLDISFGDYNVRHHAVLRVCSEGQCGWSEGMVSASQSELQLAPWGACFSEIKGKSIPQALRINHDRRDTWWIDQLEMAEIALLDLAGRLLKVPTIELLGLSGRAPVPGMIYVIANSPDSAIKQIRTARRMSNSSNVRLKIYGEASYDASLIRAARSIVGERAEILADAEGAYTLPGALNIEDLLDQLRQLQDAGLNAIEDPAILTLDEWAYLQDRLPDLALVPVKALHPAWSGQHTLRAGIGKIYKLIPSRTGSLITALDLVQQALDAGMQIAVGDHELVGPGCSAWQQIAIGLGARWVEALEKPEKMDVFTQCIRHNVTEHTTDGRIALRRQGNDYDLRPGFGLDVDEEKLRRLCAAYCTI